jgi:hypothetical protein
MQRETKNLVVQKEKKYIWNLKTRKKSFSTHCFATFLVSAIVVLCFHTDDNIMVKDALDFVGGNFPKILSRNLFCIFLFEWRKMEKREKIFFKKKQKYVNITVTVVSMSDRNFFCQINQ